MKREVKSISGIPTKRMFWSIMSEYSLLTATCELIDNAIDIWTKAGREEALTIQISLDFDRQLILIRDDAGGVPEGKHDLLISPGASDNSPDEHIIGLFGVGSKRAVIALAEEIKIQTRYKAERSFQLDIDNAWLASDSWDLPVYEIDSIDENTTIIDLSKLRITLKGEDEFELFSHLSETYSAFLKNPKFTLRLNGTKLTPVEFDAWAYPPGYEPRYYQFNLPIEDGKEVGVEITAGLVREKERGPDDYGVYFYCNDRLVMKEAKDRAVGYVTKLAGVPHSDASLARIIVRLYGPASLMPWNSSKSAIHYGHHVFQGLQHFLIPVVSDYSSLSRRFKGQWEEKVFAFPEGEMEYIDINDVEKVKRSFLPPLPKVRVSATDKLIAANRTVINDKPWTLGLVEALGAVDIISKQKLYTKNRIGLILLDSTFEIALKEFIAHEDGLNLGGKSLEQIFEQRDLAIKMVRQKVTIAAKDLSKIRHYYQMRNKLIHEKATIDLTETDIGIYLVTVQRILTQLFGLQF